MAIEQQRVERQTEVSNGKMLIQDAWNLYVKQFNSNSDLKPSTKKYREEVLTALNSTWPQFKTLDAKKVTKADCLEWRSRHTAQYSGTRVNGAITALRRIFEIAVEAAVRVDNPALKIPRARVRNKQLQLPESDQFRKFIIAVREGGGRDSKNCSDLVCFLAYGGFRLKEAARITWGDCDFIKGQILVKGDAVTGTKNWTVRPVPMIAEMRRLLERLRAARASELKETPAMQVHECQKSMNRAAKEVGMARITHHDLRHLFATRCIESGVDIPTVSRWLGHKDGGALAMKVYGHLRDQHSTTMAQKVKF